MLVLHEYYTNYYENLTTNSYNVDKQLYLDHKIWFCLTKVLKLRSEVAKYYMNFFNKMLEFEFE